LLSYTDDVDLNEKPEEWDNLYDYHRPHASHKVKTPYEVLRENLPEANRAGTSVKYHKLANAEWYGQDARASHLSAVRGVGAPTIR
jgi:hypothetical protein